MPRNETVTALDAPLAIGSADATVTIRPMRTGMMTAPRDFVFRGESGEPLVVPVPAFLLEHPTAGWILIDTGLHPAVADDPQGNSGTVGKSSILPELAEADLLTNRLWEHGVRPDQVSLVVLTHLHWDHVGGLGHLQHAPIVATRAEWDAQHADGSVTNGYDPRVLDLELDWRLLDTEATMTAGKYGFDKQFDLLDDGSIILVDTRGHSAGHISVLVRTCDGEALICGDAALTRRSIEESVPQDSAFDDSLFDRSLKQIQQFGHLSGALVIPGHDPGAFAQLPAVI